MIALIALGAALLVTGQAQLLRSKKPEPRVVRIVWTVTAGSVLYVVLAYYFPQALNLNPWLLRVFGPLQQWIQFGG